MIIICILSKIFSAGKKPARHDPKGFLSAVSYTHLDVYKRQPVITCTDSGGPLEFISHESEGLIVEPDAKAIADAIDRLAGHPVEAMKIGINGRAKYDSLELSWNKVLEALLN